VSPKWAVMKAEILGDGDGVGSASQMGRFSSPSPRRLLGRFGGACHPGFLSGRSISSYEGTWVLSTHDSSAAPQTTQIASPVCGTKNFSSVRLYSAPQLH
jgi:hypothetical protein